MKTVETAALLRLCLMAAATVWADGPGDTAVTTTAGDTAVLPCPTTGNATPSLRWTKDGRVVLSGGSAAGQRLTVLPDGSLSIRAVRPEDEGSYVCTSGPSPYASFRSKVQLQVSGRETLSTFISPAKALPNGTLVTSQGSTVVFNCSSSLYPSQQLSWAFRGDASSNDTLVSSTGPWVHFSIEDIQPRAQGNYSCRARDTVSHQAADRSTQLLVYHAPDRHPECLWKLAQDTYHVHFNCSWLGAYPPANLSWVESHGGPDEKVYLLLSKVTPSLSLTLNRSVLFEGQTVMCVAKHEALPPGKEQKCSFTITPPFPEGEPLVSALEATDVTLTCTEERSTPPAHTAWKRGLQQQDIIPGSKYILSEEGPVFKLTIVNVSKDDEGIYFCRSENPLTVRVLEVYLTVKNSSAYTGAIIGVFLAVLIVGSAIIIAKTVYSSRHRVCLGGGLGQTDDDRGDVLSLVESEDEQIFQDAVPRLPPLTNGCHTTLVQIHRIPSSDQEDTETPDTSSQQREDIPETDEPEDLVTY